MKDISIEIPRQLNDLTIHCACPKNFISISQCLKPLFQFQFDENNIKVDPGSPQR
ncbi:hypothetical protein Lalb_Chr13g0294701 [Lupinus albus]|uniref:Uncharacterized protein n=1 Tax=Lupinus albus TaxID=3870 RepID=A0A6A4PI52_LUPAL|nr:hypothetical protein Lalb_Chr13g0294701 [Lupinus albus]